MAVPRGCRDGPADGDPSPLTTLDMTTYSFAATSNASVPWDRRISVVGCLDDRPMELMTVPLEPPAGARAARTVAGEPTIRTRLGSRWRDRFAWPRMQLVQAPGPGGPIETWIASPAKAPGEPLPTIVDIHGGPLGAWAPAPSVEVVLLCGAGYRVVLPNIRGSTGYGRDWIVRTSGTGAAPTPRTSTRRSTTRSRSGSRTPTGSAPLASRMAGSWSTG